MLGIFCMLEGPDDTGITVRFSIIGVHVAISGMLKPKKVLPAAGFPVV